MKKDCLVFPLIEKDFPRIFLVSFVHGYTSCDLGLLQLVYCCCSGYSLVNAKFK
jgi:hypothetical protein